ncbi:MAG: hypothetical protein ACKVTZ_04305 [Bacteroidia bacterium]
MLKVVQKYVCNGQLQEAVSLVMSITKHNKFSNLSKEAVLLSSQICWTNKEFSMGLISNETKNVTLSRCVFATLTLAEQVKIEIKKNLIIEI